MNMNKRVRIGLIITILVIIGFVIAVLRPWEQVSLLPIVNSGTALTVNTPLGKAEVYLDGKKVGETPFSSENLDSGDHSLEIKKISGEPDFYETISKRIHLEPNTRTFVETEIGPDSQFSTHKIIYYRKNTNNDALVYIDTTPSESLVTIDDVKYGESPVSSSALSEGKHTVEVTRDGYESSETSIIVRPGYTLIAEIQLMAKPIDISSL